MKNSSDNSRLIAATAIAAAIRSLRITAKTDCDVFSFVRGGVIELP